MLGILQRNLATVAWHWAMYPIEVGLGLQKQKKVMLVGMKTLQKTRLPLDVEVCETKVQRKQRMISLCWIRLLATSFQSVDAPYDRVS
jgi:hypothetical protein